LLVGGNTYASEKDRALGGDLRGCGDRDNRGAAAAAALEAKNHHAAGCGDPER
jgi:hypothetical protein